jgi:hypothetical protein
VPAPMHAAPSSHLTLLSAPVAACRCAWNGSGGANAAFAFATRRSVSLGRKTNSQERRSMNTNGTVTPGRFVVLLLGLASLALSSAPTSAAQKRHDTQGFAAKIGLPPNAIDDVQFPLPGEGPGAENAKDGDESKAKARDCTFVNDKDGCIVEDEASYEPDDPASVRPLAEGTFDIQLVKIGNWPETKTEMERRCVRIFGRKICTKWPIVYRRTSTLWILLRVKHPVMSDYDVPAITRDCLKVAAVTGIISSIATGDLGSGAAVLQEALVACVKVEIGKRATEIGVSLRQEKDAGEWRKI